MSTRERAWLNASEREFRKTVTRQLARQLGGDVSVTSSAGKGSTFELLVPTNVGSSESVARAA